jgi:hypothetical protein
VPSLPKDLLEATLSRTLKTFPTDSKPGYLQIKLRKEKVDSFGILERKEYPRNTPFTVKLAEGLYHTYFPGFYYDTTSGIYIDKVKCNIKNLERGENVEMRHIAEDEKRALLELEFTDIDGDYDFMFVNAFKPVTNKDKHLKVIKYNNDKYPQ